MIGELKNKTVLILGGTGAIGSAIAGTFRREGAMVFQHGESGEYGADIKKEGIKKVVAKILYEVNRIDGVVNCLSSSIKLENIEKKIWQDFLDNFNVQLRAAVEVSHLLIPDMMVHKYGFLINILSSVVMEKIPRKYADYITAKYAMLGYSRCLAAEFNSYGIAVHCISPDFLRTELTVGFPAKTGEIIAANNSSGRLTVPEDIAGVALDLIMMDQPISQHVLLKGGEPKYQNL